MIIAASGALVFTSMVDGKLRASTAGGYATLDRQDAERIGRELLAWAHERGTSDGSPEQGDLPAVSGLKPQRGAL